MMRTGNPTLRSDTFTNVSRVAGMEVMTIQGAVNKTGLLLFVLFCVASWVWNNASTQMISMMVGAALIGFVCVLVATFKKEYSAICAPIYAVCEGCVLGMISLFFERMYPGIVMQAVGLTFGVLFALLIAYKSRLIKATENFKLGVFAATGGIAIMYLLNMVMGFFGASIPMIHQGGVIGILFSIFVVVIAALNLVLDFDFIEKGADVGAPKYMEWYAALGLMVTLVWLYVEILRLLSKLRDR